MGIGYSMGIGYFLGIDIAWVLSYSLGAGIGYSVGISDIPWVPVQYSLGI